jgi:tellurite resistance protein TerC
MADVTVAGWVLTFAVITGLLIRDWVRLGRRPHTVGLGDAVRWTTFYVVMAAAFSVVFSAITTWDNGAQFFAGYVVEKSLSVDNLFVFVIIIGAFAVPPEQQAKTLSIGIAIVLMIRGVFIAAGAALLEAFSFTLLIFGVGLLITAVQLFRHRDEDPHLDDNALVSLARRALPLTSTYHGKRIVTFQDGRRVATPLLLALLAIGTTDLLFAFDSIPPCSASPTRRTSCSRPTLSHCSVYDRCSS